MGLGDLGDLCSSSGSPVDIGAGKGEEKEAICRFDLGGRGGVASLRTSRTGNSGGPGCESWMVDGSSGESGEIAQDSESISWTSDWGPFDDCGWLSGTMKDCGGDSSTAIPGGG